MIRSFQFRAPTNHPGSSIKTDHSHRLIRFPTRCSSPDLGHYTVLGLTPFASQAEVKRAFKRLALKYHPDVQKGQEKDFKEIISAYECLMQKFENQEEELEEITELDETDEWEEWMGFEESYNRPCLQRDDRAPMEERCPKVLVMKKTLKKKE